MYKQVTRMLGQSQTHLLIVYNILESLLANIIFDGPRREDMPLAEHSLHLFDCSSLSLGVHENDVNAGKEVEGREQEVCAVGDVG